MELPLWSRFFFFGLHGFFDEVVFTAVHDCVVFTGFIDWKLRGYSSLWSFPMYACGSLMIERLYLRLMRGKLHFIYRGFVYAVLAYALEFSAGMILRQFNACPWDYTDYALNFMGLITLLYFPLWFFTGLYQEWITEFFLSISLPARNHKDESSNRQAVHTYERVYLNHNKSS